MNQNSSLHLWRFYGGGLNNDSQAPYPVKELQLVYRSPDAKCFEWRALTPVLLFELVLKAEDGPPFGHRQSPH